MTSKRFASVLAVAVGLALLFGGTSLLLAGPKDRHGRKHRPKSEDTAAASAKIGEKAPDFTLKDTDDREIHLADYTKDEKIVVLEWFNPECPFIKLHHENQSTFADLYKDFKDRNVVFLAVDSTDAQHPNYGKDAEAKKKWKIEYPILPDADGKVGRLYGARSTPHMFVIDKTGTLVYAGAIDNDPRHMKTGKDKVNYVRAALNDLVAGKSVATAKTQPYGCSVKYGPPPSEVN